MTPTEWKTVYHFRPSTKADMASWRCCLVCQHHHTVIIEQGVFDARCSHPKVGEKSIQDKRRSRPGMGGMVCDLFEDYPVPADIFDLVHEEEAK